MSGRTKQKIRNRLAARVLNREVTLQEARRALAAAGIPVKGAAPAAAAKSAAPAQQATPAADTLYKSRQPGLTAQQRSYLEIYDTHSAPAVREAAYRAAYPEKGTT